MSRDALGHWPDLRFRLYQAACTIIPWIPYRAGIVLALGLGWIAWFCDAPGRAQLRRNILPLLHGRKRRGIAICIRRNYCNCAMMFNDSFRLGSLPRWLLDPAQITVIDPYGSLHPRPLPQATILCTIHCHWELLLAVGRSLGLTDSLRVIARSHDDPRVDALFDRLRAAHGARSVLLDEAPLASLRALRRGRCLGIVADRDYTNHGRTTHFAGRHLPLPIGPAALALQTSSPIIPLLLLRQGHKRLILLAGKTLIPPDLDGGSNKHQLLAALHQQLATTLNRFVHAAPSQWVAFHSLQNNAQHTNAPHHKLPVKRK
ncbi:MAG: hypothetical protein EA401_14345 [Planctomycetota bacterium]|nr:MAG: hypothetical protein EA401_14345 [Planctomycetota bacterium]